MTNNERSPMELANQEIPKRWYELSYGAHFVLTGVSAASLYLLNYFVLHLDSPPNSPNFLNQISDLLKKVVRPEGVEPPTASSEAMCSIH